MIAKKLENRYTYKEYANWDDDKRWELIDGIPYMMSGPNTQHQRILGRLHIEIGTYLKGKKCEIFPAPFDVRLNHKSNDDTVVQPDLVIVCDPSIIDDKGCKGAPDMVIEILSPSSGKMDKLIKFDKYLQAGVKEYWIVDPLTETIEVFLLKDDEYKRQVYAEDSIPVTVLEECKIEFVSIFDENTQQN